jgi:hypothetical protein
MFETLAIVVGIVVVATLLLYVVDRRSKGEPMDYAILAKFGAFAGIVSGGIVVGLQSDAVSTAVETAQDMFVGKPAF